MRTEGTDGCRVLHRDPPDARRAVNGLRVRHGLRRNRRAKGADARHLDPQLVQVRALLHHLPPEPRLQRPGHRLAQFGRRHRHRLGKVRQIRQRRPRGLTRQPVQPDDPLDPARLRRKPGQMLHRLKPQGAQQRTTRQTQPGNAEHRGVAHSQACTPPHRPRAPDTCPCPKYSRRRQHRRPSAPPAPQPAHAGRQPRIHPPRRPCICPFTNTPAGGISPCHSRQAQVSQSSPHAAADPARLP